MVLNYFLTLAVPCCSVYLVVKGKLLQGHIHVDRSLVSTLANANCQKLALTVVTSKSVGLLCSVYIRMVQEHLPKLFWHINVKMT